MRHAASKGGDVGGAAEPAELAALEALDVLDGVAPREHAARATIPRSEARRRTVPGYHRRHALGTGERYGRTMTSSFNVTISSPRRTFTSTLSPAWWESSAL